MKENDIYATNSLSRHRQLAGNRVIDKETEKALGRNNTQNQNKCSSYEFGVQKENPISESSLAENDHKTIQLVLKQQINNWDGLLPDPDSFNKYSTDIQNILIEWNDIKIRTEIENSDFLAKEYVRNSKETRYFNLIIYLSTLIVTAVCYVFSGFNPLAFSFLSVPAINIGINVYKDLRSKNK